MNSQSQPGSGCSLRGLVIGTLGCLLVGAGFQYNNMLLRVSSLSGWHFTIGANIMLFLMALIVNPVVGLMRRSWALTPAELTQVYVMWIVGTAVTTSAFVSPFLPQITTPGYYASPENNWAEVLLPLVPDWAVPSKDAEVLKDFYEGRSDGAVPWGLWLPAFLHWAPLVMSLYVAMISLVVILRKQWVEHERLAYPMMQLPIAMIQDDEGSRPSLIKPLFRNWLFWAGFVLPFIIGINNGLARYWPIDPIYVSGGYFYIFRETVRIHMGINFMMIGFAYFIRRDVTLGICFFFVLYLCYQIVSTIEGGGQYDPLFSPWSRYGPSTFAFQGLGAFAALVGVGLWNARRHLLHVARCTVGLDADAEGNSGEIMSYRSAVIAAAGSLSFMSLWMWRAGLPAWIAPLFVLLAFIIYLGITRVVAEGGIPHFFPPHHRFGCPRRRRRDPRPRTGRHHRPGVHLRLGQRHDHPGDGVGSQRSQGHRGDRAATAAAALLEHGHRHSRHPLQRRGCDAGCGLRAWRAEHISILQGTGILPLGGCGRPAGDADGSELGVLGPCRARCRGDGPADDRPAAFRLVALSPDRISRQRGRHQHVPQHPPRLGTQERGPSLRRTTVLPDAPPLLSRAHHGRVDAQGSNGVGRAGTPEPVTAACDAPESIEPFLSPVAR